MWQYIVLAVVLAAAIGYVGYRLWRTIQSAGDPCHGCSGCAIHDQLKKQQQLKGRKRPVCFKGAC
ncbi:MAG: FeoB-associated Cys-rich membrane protein [Prevotella sp.]|nr:FeoB-associated Cys-rich membrane protein [Prevotella sp.]